MKEEEINLLQSILVNLIQTSRIWKNIRYYTTNLLTEDPKSKAIYPWPDETSLKIRCILGDIRKVIPDFPIKKGIDTYFCNRKIILEKELPKSRLLYKRFRHLQSYFTYYMLKSMIAQRSKKNPLQVRIYYQTVPINSYSGRKHTRNSKFYRWLNEQANYNELCWCIKLRKMPWMYSIKIHYTLSEFFLNRHCLPKLKIETEKQKWSMRRSIYSFSWSCILGVTLEYHFVSILHILF